MNKVRKIILLVIIVFLCVCFGCSSCGGDNGGSTTPDTPVTPSEDNLVVAELIAAIDQLPSSASESIQDQVYVLFAKYQALSFSDRTQVTNRQHLLDLVTELNNLSDNKVKLAIAAITAIGLVSLDSKSAINYALNLYNQLSSEEKAKITNHDRLVTAETTYQTLVNQQKVEEVEALISLIGIVDYDSEALIASALSAYQKLSSSLQNQVTNAQVLTDAQNAYNALVSETSGSVQDVINRIKALPFSLNYQQKDVASSVVNKYNNLSSSQKDEVINKNVIDKWTSQLLTFADGTVDVYPLYTKESNQQMLKAFVGEFYKYLLENNPIVLTNHSFTYDSFMSFFTTSSETNLRNTLKTSSYQDLVNAFVENNEFGLPCEYATSSFIGYTYQSHRYHDLIDSLYVIYSENAHTPIDVLVKVITTLKDDSKVLGGVVISDSLPHYQYLKTSTTSSGSVTIKTHEFSRDEVGYTSELIDCLMAKASQTNQLDVYEDVNKRLVKLSNDEFSALTQYDNYLNSQRAFYYSDKLSAMTLENALVAMAYAYSYQGTQSQYDQHFRRLLNVMPEYATEDEILFFDCSSFVNSVFYATFGQNIHGITSNVFNSSKTAVYQDWCEAHKYDVIEYFEVKNYTTDSARQAKIDELKALLQPGDMLVYQHNNGSYIAGHVMLYVGDGKFIHSSGKSISRTSPSEFYEATTTKEEMYGSVLCESWNEVFNSIGSRYIFLNSSEDKMLNVGIFRPTMMSGLTVTKEATARYLYNDIMVEKSASINNRGTIIRNSNITYTVLIENAGSSNTSFVYAEEKIPTGMEFVSATYHGQYDQSTNTIKWLIGELPANTQVTITYTLKATGSVGSVITDNQTSICGIKTNTITHHIGSQLDLATMNSYLSSNVGKASNGGLALVKAIYNAAGKSILSSFTSSSSILSDVIVNKKPNTSSSLASQLVLYSGYTGIGDNNSLKAVTTKSLESGDIIIVSLNESTTCYYYQDEAHIYGVTDKVITLNYGNETAVSQFLLSLCVYDQAIVLRPALN